MDVERGYANGGRAFRHSTASASEGRLSYAQDEEVAITETESTVVEVPCDLACRRNDTLIESANKLDASNATKDAARASELCCAVQTIYVTCNPNCTFSQAVNDTCPLGTCDRAEDYPAWLLNQRYTIVCTHLCTRL